MKPLEALKNWSIPELADIDSSKLEKPTSGLLNKTYMIRGTSNQLYIFQCVHPAVSMDGALNNYFHVTQFLRENNMVSQELLLTKNGNLYIEDEAGWRWRLLKGVEGLYYQSTTDPVIAHEGGKLLGQFHTILSQYPKKLEIGRLSFRYEAEVEKLKSLEKQLMEDEDDSIKEATQLILKAIPKLMLPKSLPQQIIHADPKISNFLFSKNNTGICMIDLDTIQMHSPLYDIGDALRSWCGKEEDDPQNSFNLKMYDAFLKGYMSTSKGLLSTREQLLIPQAIKLIVLGLTTRFLNDYIEDSYFGFDETRFNSRKDHNKARVLGQLSLYRSFLKLT